MANDSMKRGFTIFMVVFSALAALALVGVIGVNVAAANNGSSRADTFGIEKSSSAPVSSPDGDFATETVDATYGSSVLSQSAPRDIDAGIQAIEAEEKAAEEARLAKIEAENKAALDRAEKAMSRYPGSISSLGLSAVDWTVGHDAFVEEWSQRIDRFLAGSPLAGQGIVFAEAAWNNGMDPRWSPAISRTESSKGAICFKPYNAWGWGDSSWTNWEDAINAHVAGLARGYGYTISFAGAQKYCPPNYENWFNNTLSGMKSI